MSGTGRGDQAVPALTRNESDPALQQGGQGHGCTSHYKGFKNSEHSVVAVLGGLGLGARLRCYFHCKCRDQ